MSNLLQYTDEIQQAMARWNGILPTPSREALKSPKGLSVYENKWIETKIARANWYLPGLWVAPLTVFLWIKGLAYQTAGATLALALFGLVSWTLLEYLLHMFLFHRKLSPTTSPKTKELLFMLHGYHHEYPNDPGRLVMPVIIAWPLALILGTALWLVLGPSYFYGFYTGLVVGYLAYDWTHYYLHHARPKGRVGKYLQEFHMIHHFIDQDHNFGLSSPLWDWILGNNREPKTKLFGDSSKPSTAQQQR